MLSPPPGTPFPRSLVLISQNIQIFHLSSKILVLRYELCLYQNHLERLLKHRSLGLTLKL